MWTYNGEIGIVKYINFDISLTVEAGQDEALLQPGDEDRLRHLAAQRPLAEMHEANVRPARRQAPRRLNQ